MSVFGSPAAAGVVLEAGGQPLGAVLLTAALLAAVLLGLGLGYALAGILRRRREAVAGSGGEVTIAELLLRLVRSSRSGIVVLGSSGEVLLHNARATDMGLVRTEEVDARARRVAETVARTGQRAEIDLSPVAPPPGARGRAPEAVAGEITSLGNGFTALEAVDHSEAVRLEATRRDFVANVSHELKTPVGAIGLLAEALMDAADDPEGVRRFGEKLTRESNRLAALVSELIALSRLEGAEKLPEPEIVSVDEVVVEALGRVRAAADAEGSTLTTDRGSGLEIDGDRTLLVTALANLLANAVAYSPSGSPVSISRRLVASTVEIGVTDRGIGIAEEDQQRVFERFYRVDKARSRVTGGTGLGLAIVKHVAANHGGDVRLWSSPGTGSTFTLRIPASSRAGQPAATQPGGTQPGERGGPQPGERGRPQPGGATQRGGVRRR